MNRQSIVCCLLFLTYLSAANSNAGHRNNPKERPKAKAGLGSKKANPNATGKKQNAPTTRMVNASAAGQIQGSGNPLKPPVASTTGQSNKGNQVFQNNGVIQNNLGTPTTSKTGDPSDPQKPSLTIVTGGGHISIKAVLEPPTTILNVVAARAGVSLFYGEALPARPISLTEEGLTFDQLDKVLAAYLGASIVPLKKAGATVSTNWFISLPSGDLATGAVRVTQSGSVATIQANNVSKDQFAAAISFIENARTSDWKEDKFDAFQAYIQKNPIVVVKTPTALTDFDTTLAKYDPTKPLGGADSPLPWLAGAKSTVSYTGVWNLSFVNSYVPDPTTAGAGQTPPAAGVPLIDPGVQAIVNFLNTLEGAPPPAAAGTPGGVGQSSGTPAATSSPATTPAAGSATTGAGSSATTAPATGSGTATTPGSTSQTLSVTVSSSSTPASASSQTQAATPPKPKVTVSPLGRNLMMTGDFDEVQRLRRLLATAIDIPSAQVRLDLYTFQATSDVTKRKKVPLLRKDVQILREGMLMSKSLQDSFVGALHGYIHGLARPANGASLADGLGISSSHFGVDVPELLRRGGFDPNPNRTLSLAEIFAFMLFDPARQTYPNPSASVSTAWAADISANQAAIYKQIVLAVQKMAKDLQDGVAKANLVSRRGVPAQKMAIVGQDLKTVIKSSQTQFKNLQTTDNPTTFAAGTVSKDLAKMLSDAKAVQAADQLAVAPTEALEKDSALIEAVEKVSRAVQAASGLAVCASSRRDRIFVDALLFTDESNVRPFAKDVADKGFAKAVDAYFAALYQRAALNGRMVSLQDYLQAARENFEGQYRSQTDPRLKDLFEHYDNLLQGDMRMRRHGSLWSVMVSGQDISLSGHASVPIVSLGGGPKQYILKSTGLYGYGQEEHLFVDGEIRMEGTQPILIAKSKANEEPARYPLYDHDVLFAIDDRTGCRSVPTYLPQLCGSYAATNDLTDQRSLIEFAKYWTLSANFENLDQLEAATVGSPTLTWEIWKKDDVAGHLSNASSGVDKGLKVVADALHTDLREMCMNPLISWEESEFGQSADGVGFHGANSIVVSSTAPAIQSTQTQTFFQYQQPLSAQAIAKAFAASTSSSTGVGSLLGLGSGATAANALANLLGSAVGAENSPVYNRVAPGVSLAVQPSVLRDGESARLQILLQVTDAPDTNTNQVTTHQDLTSSSKLTTDVNVAELDLFQLTSADFRVSGPVSFPKGLFGLATGHGTKTEDLDTVICVQVSILPRSLDLAGKFLTLDLTSSSPATTPAKGGSK